MVRICPVFSIFDSRLKERHLNELLFQYVQADLEFVERSFADEEQYSEPDYKHGAKVTHSRSRRGDPEPGCTQARPSTAQK